MIYTIYPWPISFCPSVSFCPLYHFAPLSFCPPPPWNRLMIYAIYPCPLSFCPWIHFAPGFILPPFHFAPWKSFNVHYFPISVSFCPLSFCPHIILPPWKLFHDCTIYPCPVSFYPLYSFCPHIILPPIILPPWKWLNNLHYLPISRIILPPALDFVFILIKSPLQQKLMTGAHPVTVAPLVK